MVLASAISEVVPALAFALLCLLAMGAPLAMALTRSAAIAGVLAPVVAALLSSGAALSAIATRSPFEPWAIAWVGASWALAFWLWRRGRALIDLEVPPLTVVVLVLVSAIALMSILRAPIGWDARTLWWFHAEWIEEGGDAFAEAATTPATSWAHADYPPFASAAVASVRSIGGGVDSSRLAQAVSTLVSWSALLLIGVGLCATLRGRRWWLEGTFAGVVLLGIAGALRGDGSITSGYVDYLWSCLAAAAAVFLLAHRRTRSAVIIGSICLAGAALTKNEGLVAGVLLCVLALLRHRSTRRDLPIVAAALVPGICWAVLARVLGATSDVAEGGNPTGLLRGDPEVWDRLRPTLRALSEVRYSIPITVTVAVCAITAVLGAIALSDTRRRSEVGSDLWLWISAMGMVGLMVAAYLVSPLDITFHLRAASRTMLAPTIVVLVSATIWVRLAVRYLARTFDWPRSSSPEVREPEPGGAEAVQATG